MSTHLWQRIPRGYAAERWVKRDDQIIGRARWPKHKYEHCVRDATSHRQPMQVCQWPPSAGPSQGDEANGPTPHTTSRFTWLFRLTRQQLWRIGYKWSCRVRRLKTWITNIARRFKRGSDARETVQGHSEASRRHVDRFEEITSDSITHMCGLPSMISTTGGHRQCSWHTVRIVSSWSLMALYNWLPVRTAQQNTISAPSRSKPAIKSWRLYVLIYPPMSISIYINTA